MKTILVLVAVAIVAATAATHKLAPSEIASYQSSSEPSPTSNSFVATSNGQTYYYGQKEFGIDTTPNTLFASSKEANPYWEVTLNQEMFVSTIVAVNRKDCCHHRFVNGRIILYDANGLPKNYTGIVQRDGNNEMTFTLNSNAHRIRLVLEHGDTFLEIQDMDIQVDNAYHQCSLLTASDIQSIDASPLHTGGVNPYTDFTTYGLKEYGMDTNELTFYHSDSRSNPYWEVTLSGTHHVQYVEAEHRRDCCDSRFINGRLRLYNTVGTVIYTSALTQDDANKVMHFTGINTQDVKRVRLTLETTGFLELGDMRIFVTPPPSVDYSLFCDEIQAKCTALSAECATIRNGQGPVIGSGTMSNQAGNGGVGEPTGGVTLSGNSVVVTATGVLSCGAGCPTTGPNGDSLPGSGMLLPGVNRHSLLARIGAGPWQFIGAGPTTLTGTGALTFAFNDGNYPDNTGSWDITIRDDITNVADDCDASAAACDDVEADCRAKVGLCPSCG